MSIIKHGVPTHDYFTIVLPLSKIKPSLEELNPDYKPPIKEFLDPKTNTPFHASIIKIATLSLSEFQAQGMLSLITYGLPAEVIIPELRRKYPEIHKTEKIRFILCKKI